MLTKFVVEKDNRYGAKARYVALANDNESFKNYLIEIAGWSEADFRSLINTLETPNS